MPRLQQTQQIFPKLAVLFLTRRTGFRLKTKHSKKNSGMMISLRPLKVLAPLIAARHPRDSLGTGDRHALCRPRLCPVSVQMKDLAQYTLVFRVIHQGVQRRRSQAVGTWTPLGAALPGHLIVKQQKINSRFRLTPSRYST